MSKHKDIEQENEDDMVFEETEEGKSTFNTDLNKKIADLKEKLEKCESEKKDYLDGWQRSKADYVNLKKRNEEERSGIIKIAREDLILEIIGVVDIFEMAINNPSWKDASETWRKGIEFIFGQIKGILSNNDVSEINPVGEKFDHNTSEAIETIPVDSEEEDHLIKEVIKKGYKVGDKIIRHAVVKVGELKK